MKLTLNQVMDKVVANFDSLKKTFGNPDKWSLNIEKQYQTPFKEYWLCMDLTFLIEDSHPIDLFCLFDPKRIVQDGFVSLDDWINDTLARMIRSLLLEESQFKYANRQGNKNVI